MDEQPPRRTVKRFRGGLVFEAHGLLYHSTLSSRVIKKKKKKMNKVSVVASLLRSSNEMIPKFDDVGNRASTFG